MTSAKVAVPVLQEVLDAFNAHDLDLIMSFFADDCVMDMPHGPGPGGNAMVGEDEARKDTGSRRDGIPRTSMTATTTLVLAITAALSQPWTMGGTQRNGERIEVRGCDLFEFVDGKISRKDAFWKIIA